MKRSFILIEILISFTLVSIILGALFSLLYETTHIKSRLEKAERAILDHAEFQQRLSGIFARFDEKGYFYLEKDEDKRHTLYFTYDCGIDADPRFCKQVEARLILKKETFILQVLPNIVSKLDKCESRFDKLKSYVKEVNYEFLHEGKTFSTWNKNKKNHPSYIKITLTLKNNLKEAYVFWISHKIEGVLLK